MKLLIAMAGIAVAACAAPIERHIEVIDGQAIEFRDADDGTIPCSADWTVGCYQLVRDLPTIWLSRIASEDQRAHEIAHAKGMEHSAWGRFEGHRCAIVTRAGGGYFVGQKICAVGNGYAIL